MRFKFLALLVANAILPFSHFANAQQPSKIPRIGYVRVVGAPSIPGPNVEAFRHGLKDLGYVEGKNIAD